MEYNEPDGSAGAGLWVFEPSDTSVVALASWWERDDFSRSPPFLSYLGIFNSAVAEFGCENMRKLDFDRLVPGATLAHPPPPGSAPETPLARTKTDPDNFRRSVATGDDIHDAVEELGGSATPAQISRFLALGLLGDGIIEAESAGRIRWMNEMWCSL